MAHAAGGGVHQHGIARLNRIGMFQEITRRHALHQDAGQGNVINAFGDFYQGFDRINALLGISAQRRQAISGLIADAELRHAITSGDDLAYGLEAQDRR